MATEILVLSGTVQVLFTSGAIDRNSGTIYIQHTNCRIFIVALVALVTT
jgi:hypothetical protein